MKQAIQLEIDFGPELRVAPVAAAASQPSISDRAELRILSAVRSAAAAFKAALPALLTFIGSAVAVLGCFALMFFAALLQG